MATNTETIVTAISEFLTANTDLTATDAHIIVIGAVYDALRLTAQNRHKIKGCGIQ